MEGLYRGAEESKEKPQSVPVSGTRHEFQHEAGVAATRPQLPESFRTKLCGINKKYEPLEMRSSGLRHRIISHSFHFGIICCFPLIPWRWLYFHHAKNSKYLEHLSYRYMYNMNLTLIWVLSGSRQQNIRIFVFLLPRNVMKEILWLCCIIVLMIGI